MTRVATLLPGATEIVAALGAGASLVGVSHECDTPAWVVDLPRLTTTPLDPALRGRAIDAEVRRLMESGHPVIGLDADMLRSARPDLLITQALCEVCAVSDGQAHRLGDVLSPPPEVLTMRGVTVEGVLDDIHRIGDRLGVPGEADELTAGLRYRMRRLRAAAPARGGRVLCLEWLEPLYVAGHWVPELVAGAGGVDVGAEAGAKSVRKEWHDVHQLRPDAVIVMLCGFGVARSREELDAFTQEEGLAGRHPLEFGCPVWILDANAYTSRAGPRIIDGAERIAAALRGEAMEGLVRYT